MKLLNKIMLLAAGVSTVAVSCLFTNNLIKAHADERETATIVFDGNSNTFCDRNGDYSVTTSNNNTVAYSVDISSNLEVETNGASLKLRSTDDQNNYYLMHFESLKGIKSIHTVATARTNITTTAYHYGTSTFVGYIGNDAVAKDFVYTFSDSEQTSDLWKLSIVLRCPPNATIMFGLVEITYSVNDCKALN